MYRTPTSYTREGLVMARDYDQIMATVARASAPVAEAYRRVQEEYGWLVAQLKQRIPE